MSLLESADLQAREDIVRLKEEQYAQSELIRSAKDCCAKNEKRLEVFEVKTEGRVKNLERRFTDCDSKHESHNLHRRQSDKEMSVIAQTLGESLTVNKKTQETLVELLGEVKSHKETVDRSRNSQTTMDGVKNFFIYLAVISAGLYGIKQITLFLSP